MYQGCVLKSTDFAPSTALKCSLPKTLRTPKYDRQALCDEFEPSAVGELAKTFGLTEPDLRSFDLLPIVCGRHHAAALRPDGKSIECSQGLQARLHFIKVNLGLEKRDFVVQFAFVDVDVP